VRIIIRDQRASGAFRTRRSGRNGRRSGGNGRSSGRRWSIVGFKDNVLMVWNWPPFIKYDIIRPKKFACGLVNEVKGAVLFGEPKECAGQCIRKIFAAEACLEQKPA
jgi:hypothetical protein